jgi:hypothetical protein
METKLRKVGTCQDQNCFTFAHQTPFQMCVASPSSVWLYLPKTACQDHLYQIMWISSSASSSSLIR